MKNRRAWCAALLLVVIIVIGLVEVFEIFRILSRARGLLVARTETCPFNTSWWKGQLHRNKILFCEMSLILELLLVTMYVRARNQQGG